MNLRDRLVNWAIAMQGYTGPEIPNKCASAERDYLPEAGDVWDDDQPILPDMLDANLVEIEVVRLRKDLKSIIKATYIQFPYENEYYIGHRLRLSPLQVKEKQREAHERLAQALGHTSEIYNDGMDTTKHEPKVHRKMGKG